MPSILYNGKIIDAGKPVFTAANRGYRYGDGFFETIRIVNGGIPLLQFHKERIERSINFLEYIRPAVSLDEIFVESLNLSTANNCNDNARLRISFFNGSGSVFDDNAPLEYLVETAPITRQFNFLNEWGLTGGVCPIVIKSCDPYSNLKSANYLFSRKAVDFAKKNGWDDAFIKNQFGNICESAIANIFWVKNGIVHTPPLSEGCVQGVLRSYLLTQIPVTEKVCGSDDLQNADEIFLTNATTGLRWVKNFGEKEYSCTIARQLYKDHIAPLWAS